MFIACHVRAPDIRSRKKKKVDLEVERNKKEGIVDHVHRVWNVGEEFQAQSQRLVKIMLVIFDRNALQEQRARSNLNA